MDPLRTFFLAASQSRRLRELLPKYRFVRRAVSRFLPGEDLDAALEAARALRSSGAGAVLTCLGENLKDATEAEEVTGHYLEVLERARQASLDAEISIKPTQLGLDFSRQACEKNLSVLVERAGALGTWVWVDMESTATTDATLDLYRRVRARHPNVGVCVQAYLYRTAADLAGLIGLGAGIRLVKGAYREPSDRAFPGKKEVDASFLDLARRLLSKEARSAGVRAIFGTHDAVLIRRLEDEARSAALPPEALEFQMLYGIRRQEQARLAAAGHRFRVLISYGDAWFAWYMRRLAERPANVLFVLKSLFTS